MTLSRNVSIELLVLILGVVGLKAQPSDRTNQAAISYPSVLMNFESTDRSEVLTERFFQEVVASDSVVFDRFTGCPMRLAWTRGVDRLGYSSLDRWNADGARLFRTIALDSFRTAAMEVLPFERWQDYWQGRYTDLITGTLGNPLEEHIQVTSVSYSAVRSYWEKEKENGKALQWGFRPWRTSPYVYLFAHAGRMDGRPLVTFEGRAGYTLLASTRVEGRLTLQLPGSFRLAGGATVDPRLLGTRDMNASLYGVSLERLIRVFDRVPDSVFYIGFRSGAYNGNSNSRHENLLVAGLARPW